MDARLSKSDAHVITGVALATITRISALDALISPLSQTCQGSMHDPKAIPNGHHIDPKAIPNGPQIDPKSTSNRPQIDPKSTPNSNPMLYRWAYLS